jgi:hypothetical protein
MCANGFRSFLNLKAEAAMGDDKPSSDVLAFAINESDIEKIMAWPNSVIGSDGDSSGAHPAVTVHSPGFWDITSGSVVRSASKKVFSPP